MDAQGASRTQNDAKMTTQGTSKSENDTKMITKGAPKPQNDPKMVAQGASKLQNRVKKHPNNYIKLTKCNEPSHTALPIDRPGGMRGAVRRPGLAQDGVLDCNASSCPTLAQLLPNSCPSLCHLSFLPSLPNSLPTFALAFATFLFVFGALSKFCIKLGKDRQ